MSVYRPEAGPGFAKEEKESTFFGISVASENKNRPIPGKKGIAPFSVPVKAGCLVFRVWHVS
jgi:hypothetical protein